MAVEYVERGNITDVMVDGRYMGCVVLGDDGKYRTVHKNNALPEVFTIKHFATYHVEKAKPL
ncbi:hypothetical protein [Citrobacter sp. Igbk 16]|uniref:hypothetical protein n=1 Tax=Citrobacter sp. Igbk 16 TaxID=2963958 RepID=UPI0023026C8C|nr:hypothetical protein [Citrobacter sp. Igbk 16]MDA8518981.1 hypothetical protein [Citrobacter sp. Igbk 16]